MKPSPRKGTLLKSPVNRIAKILGALILTTIVQADFGKAAEPDLAQVLLVKENQPQSVIVIPDADDEVKARQKQPPWIEFQTYSLWHTSSRLSAELLARYIERSTSAKLQVFRESEAPEGKTQIHVGPTKFALGLGLLEGMKDSSGFVIKAVSPERLVLLGGGPMGTEYAVYEFLESRLGVRWLFPGKDWEVVEPRESIEVGGPEIRQEPGFYSRVFRYGTDEGTEWCRRNRIHNRIEFHHNIPKLVDMSYTKTNPEYFPLIKGERRLPTALNQDNWHPCWAEEGLADAMAAKVEKFLTDNPEYESVSLGVADGDGGCYCTCPKCENLRSGDTNSFGFADYSDLHYGWAAHVASRVAKSHPETLFGTLAYREVIDPPKNMRVPDNIVPYVTWESLQWTDPKRRKEFQERFTRWSERASRMGVYDYVWLGSYDIPLIYPGVLSEYLRFVRENNAIGNYTETRLRRTEDGLLSAPMMYALARLLWNPQTDVRAMMSDWYEKAVGPKAAPFLAEYFALWEDYWTKRVQSTPWFGTKNSLYLMFNQKGYLSEVRPEDIDRSLELLGKVVAAAGTMEEKRRAELLRDEFADRVPALRYQCAMAALTGAESTELKTLDTPLVLDQDFSDGPQGWLSRIEIKGLPWDRAEGNEGPGALKIKAWKTGLGDNATASVLVLWQARVKPATKYLLEFAAKSQGRPTNTVVTVDLDWRDKAKDENKLKPFKLSIALPMDRIGRDWRKSQVTFSTPEIPDEEGSHYFDAWLTTKNLGEGVIWIDDVKVFELEN